MILTWVVKNLITGVTVSARTLKSRFFPVNNSYVFDLQEFESEDIFCANLIFLQKNSKKFSLFGVCNTIFLLTAV
jgi:hypothetical protein